MTIDHERSCSINDCGGLGWSIAGANGYVTKQEMSETMLIAIRRVLNGEKYVSPKIRARLACS